MSNSQMKKDIELPKAPTPVGAYETGIIRQGIGFVSGQFPIRKGKLAYTGRVGDELSQEQAYEATEIAALNVLSQIQNLTDGFKYFGGLLRLDGYIASAPGFLDQPAVLDAASLLFRRYLGERGRHARAAFSVSQLPLNSPVELCVTFATLTRKN